jgi:hypothetical protein
MELASGYMMDHRQWMVESRLLRPLVDFGLVEREKNREQAGSGTRRAQTRFRTTGLYHQFLKFDLASDPSLFD